MALKLQQEDKPEPLAAKLAIADNSNGNSRGNSKIQKKTAQL